MTTKTILKATLTAIITCGLMFSSALDHSSDPNKLNLDAPSIYQTPGSQIVKGLIINGEVYPMIELPVVEITGDLSTDHLVRGEVIQGEIVPSIMLDEIVIKPNS